MKRFKKLLCVVLAVMTMSVLFAGCGKNDGAANGSGSAEFEKIKVAYVTNNVDETFVTMKNAYETVSWTYIKHRVYVLRGSKGCWCNDNIY